MAIVTLHHRKLLFLVQLQCLNLTHGNDPSYDCIVQHSKIEIIMFHHF